MGALLIVAAIMTISSVAVLISCRLRTEAHPNGAWSHLFWGRKVQLNRLDVLGEMPCRDLFQLHGTDFLSEPNPKWVSVFGLAGQLTWTRAWGRVRK
jgi:hypothetical protein